MPSKITTLCCPGTKIIVKRANLSKPQVEIYPLTSNDIGIDRVIKRIKRSNLVTPALGPGTKMVVVLHDPDKMYTVNSFDIFSLCKRI